MKISKLSGYIKKSHIMYVWIFMFVLFADLANLDDFIPGSDILHDEYISTVSNQDFAGSGVPSNIITSSLFPAGSHIKIQLFDQDSQSISPINFFSLFSFIKNCSDQQNHLKSIVISKELYLSNKALLI